MAAHFLAPSSTHTELHSDVGFGEPGTQTAVQARMATAVTWNAKHMDYAHAESTWFDLESRSPASVTLTLVNGVDDL